MKTIQKLWILLLAGVMLLCGCAAQTPYAVDSMSAENTPANTNGGFATLGRVCTDGAQVFYATADGIQKTDAAGETSILLKTKSACDSLNLVGERLVFRGEDHKIYQMDTDGGNKTRLLDQEVLSVWAAGARVYFTDLQSNLYLLKDEPVRLATGVANLQFGDDKLYYLKQDPLAATATVCAMALDGGAEQTVAEAAVYYSLNIEGNNLYYARQENKRAVEFRLNLDGGETRLCESGYSVNIQDGWLYAVDVADRTLYRASLDGKQRVSLGVQCDLVSLVGGYLYCTDFKNGQSFRITPDGKTRESL